MSAGSNTENSGEDPQPSPGRNAPNNSFRLALEETERVGKRIEGELGDRLDALYLLAGMIPNASRRIITEIGAAQTTQDRVIVVHCSRVFNNAMGAYILLRGGMIGEATILARSLVESVAQATLFLRDETAASEWLRGKDFTPGAVRNHLKRFSDTPDFRELYASLSGASHANARGRSTYTYELSVGQAISYGGGYQPKSAAGTLTVVAYLVGIFLREFWMRYNSKLTIAAWPPIVELANLMTDNLHRWALTLPDDGTILEPHLRSMSVEPMPAMPAIDPASWVRIADEIHRARQQAPTQAPSSSSPTQSQEEPTHPESSR
jgi:hypothetical protein